MHAYDPTDEGKTTGTPFHLHNHNISNVDDPEAGKFRLKSLLDKNGHRNKKISVLSLNLYGAEFKVLRALLKDDGLKNVDHLTVTFHVKKGNIKLQ